MKSTHLVSAFLTSLLLVSSCQNAPIANVVTSAPAVQPSQVPLILPDASTMEPPSWLRGSVDISHQARPSEVPPERNVFENFKVNATQTCQGTDTLEISYLPEGCSADYEVYENGVLLASYTGITTPGIWTTPIGCSCGPIVEESYITLSGSCGTSSGRYLVNSVSGTITCPSGTPMPSSTPTPAPTSSPPFPPGAGRCSNEAENKLNTLANQMNALAAQIREANDQLNHIKERFPEFFESAPSSQANPGSQTNEDGFHTQLLDPISLGLVLTGLRTSAATGREGLNLMNAIGDYGIAKATSSLAAAEADVEALNQRRSDLHASNIKPPLRNEINEQIQTGLNNARERIRRAQTAIPLIEAYREKSDLLLEKIAQLEDGLDFVGRLIEELVTCDVEEPSPEPTPPSTPTPRPTRSPRNPGCLRQCNDSMDVLDRDGNVLKHYGADQCQTFEGHNIDQPDPITVFQDEEEIGDLSADCFKPDTKLPNNRTNLEWMKAGYSPCDPSGLADSRGKQYVTQLHHNEQNPHGPLAEMSTPLHQQASHPNRTNSQIVRDPFNSLTKKYWKLRAKQLEEGDAATACPPLP
ncbi:MAG: hypothetical protein CVV27_01015 [Candidatus Melainabacteria bacterium HGW-Melainabacteria-1]|nr:MAG: hypothetical protein CVV27_01015 [Candidatus Melainabacteria bacterium HGW-Melainabacteria-1]